MYRIKACVSRLTRLDVIPVPTHDCPPDYCTTFRVFFKTRARLESYVPYQKRGPPKEGFPPRPKDASRSAGAERTVEKCTTKRVFSCVRAHKRTLFEVRTHKRNAFIPASRYFPLPTVSARLDRMRFDTSRKQGGKPYRNQNRPAAPSVQVWRDLLRRPVL